MKKVTFQILCSSFLLLPLAMTSCRQSKFLVATPKLDVDPLIAHIDSTIRPQDDFFQYANGKWFKQNPIPASEPSNGIFQIIEDTVNAQVLHICKLAATETNPEGSNKQKIGDFYFSGMDSITRNQKGISDLKEYLNQINNIKDKGEVFDKSAFVNSVSNSTFFNFGVAQDDKNSSKYQVYITQGGLTMPDRNYYTDNDTKAEEIRNKFVCHVEKVFAIMGYEEKEAVLLASKLMELETNMARLSRKREDTRDPFANYNKMSVDSLKRLTPHINWNVYMKGVGLQQVDSVVVGQPEYLAGLDKLVNQMSLADLKSYMKFRFFEGLDTFLDDRTYDESFDFYNKTLRGVTEQRPRWKRVVSLVNGYLGDLIGQVYVDEYLPKGTKDKLIEIGNAIRNEFAERIKGLDWMSDATKEKALVKLNAVMMKMCSPDKWKDLSALNIDHSSYVHNAMNANKWFNAYNIHKYGKPVDRTEWDMEPQTYNAYYNPSNNEIVIPGCNIIVPGFEKKMADDAILYAIIGGTIGHEITHGFDDQGCQYDAQGNLKNWWTKDDKTKFDEQTKKIVNQFDNYFVSDSLHINGSLTQGENIADLGGIIMAYEAFKKTPQFKHNEIIDGLNPSQRFFLGYAMEWMVNMRPEALMTQVKSNEHAPAKWRVLAPLSNMPEFYQTFGVKQGDKMWRSDKDRVKIW